MIKIKKNRFKKLQIKRDNICYVNFRIQVFHFKKEKMSEITKNSKIFEKFSS